MQNPDPNDYFQIGKVHHLLRAALDVIQFYIHLGKRNNVREVGVGHFSSCLGKSNPNNSCIRSGLDETRGGK